MPASAPSAETIVELMRLRFGALDLYMYLLASADAEGCSRLTEAQIAQATGRSVRWVSKAAVELRTNGWLEGGHGMWKIRSTSDVEETFHHQEQTFLNERATNENERSTNQHVRSTSEPAPPPPTPPTRTRESAYVVVLDVNENENDVVDGKGGAGEKPRKPKREQATKVPDSFQPDAVRVALAAELGISGRLDRERQAFIDHSQAKPARYADHQRAFANWLRKSREFHGPERNGHGPWQAWETVLSVLDFTVRNGRRPDERPDDPALHQAVAALGGWDALSGNDFQRAHFIRAYQEFSKGVA